jgi:hypothetical protein
MNTVRLDLLIAVIIKLQKLLKKKLNSCQP